MYKVRKVECVLAYVCVCENPQKSEVVDFIWYIYSHIPYICVKSAEGWVCACVCVRVWISSKVGRSWFHRVCIYIYTRTKSSLESSGCRTRPMKISGYQPRLTHMGRKPESNLVRSQWYKSNQRVYTGSKSRIQKASWVDHVCAQSAQRCVCACVCLCVWNQRVYTGSKPRIQEASWVDYICAQSAQRWECACVVCVCVWIFSKVGRMLIPHST